VGSSCSPRDYARREERRLGVLSSLPSADTNRFRFSGFDANYRLSPVLGHPERIWTIAPLWLVVYLIGRAFGTLLRWVIALG